MFDTEKLIIEIQNRVSLWNTAEKSYSDKRAQQRAWEEIGKCFHEDWDESNVFFFFYLLLELRKCKQFVIGPFY
jgi:hypothetical protein